MSNESMGDDGLEPDCILCESEAAKMLQCTSRQVRKLAIGGVIPVVLLPIPDGRFRFSKRDLWAWISEHRREAPSPMRFRISPEVCRISRMLDLDGE